MKLLLNRKPVDGPWGGGNLLVKALCENAEAHDIQIVHKFEVGIDAILMLDPHPDELGIGANQLYVYSKTFNIPIIHRVNECDARKDTANVDKTLRACSSITRTTIFVSNWMQKYHTGLGWNCRDHRVVYNGVNHEHFRPCKKLDNGKINIVAHHWSNNYKKGFDIYDKLDTWVGKNDEFTFTYIGRERGTFKNTTVIDSLHGQALGDVLGQYDVYVSASRQDPGPNHVIEAVACGMPTYTIRDGGGACEFASVAGVYKDFRSLVRKLRKKDFEKAANAHGWTISWEACADRFFDIIKEVASK